MGGLFKLKAMYNGVIDIKLEDKNTVEPVLLPEMKFWLRLDIDDDDELVSSLIITARQQIEGFLNRSIVPKLVTAILNNSLGSIYFPYAPVTTPKEDIVLKDRYDNVITNADVYGLDYPYLMMPNLDYVYCEYSTGYEDIPGWAILAIKQQVSWLYENRGDDTKIGQLSPLATATLKPYRLI